jgi:hypothetical protein
MKSTTTRRRFFGGAAILAAPLAAGAAVAGERPSDDLSARLAALEDANAIRAALQGYVRRVNLGAEPPPAADVHGLVLDSDAAIDVADGTAKAEVPCTVETATPIEPCGTLVEMARLQGDGIVKCSERRVLVAQLVKRGEAWKVEHTELRA